MSRNGRVHAILGCVALCAAAVWAHDMFLVLPDHDLPAHAAVRVELFNGTFETSQNTIDRDRMLDVSVVDGAGAVTGPGPEAWHEEGDVTVLSFETGAPGTYLVGVSTRARMIELSAKEFNEYLEHDGVLDVLADREAQGVLDRDANERYSKHVKTVVQVGGVASGSFSHRLGYPIEIVPLANPAELEVGGELEVLVLAGGEPVAGQLVYAGHEGHDAHGEAGEHREPVTTRTDDLGMASVPISRSGRWYVRLIRMLPVEEAGVDYESNWATLTFEVPAAD